MNVGVRIRVALALLGCDREWLTRRSRLGRSTIDRLLHDPTREATPPTLKQVARVLGTSASWLTADPSQRALTPEEHEELQRSLQTLRNLARGRRIDARTHPNAVRAPDRRVPRPFAALGARHAFRVRGNSLSGFGLLDGDTVFVKPLMNGNAQIRGAVGSLVLSQLNGALYLHQLTIAPGNAVVLRSAHTGFDPLTIAPDDDWKLLGQVVASARIFGSPVSDVQER